MKSNQPKKNILLLRGGGGSEHDISVISASYIEKTLEHNPKYQVYSVEITKEGHWITPKDGKKVELSGKKNLSFEDGQQIELHAAIPCLHGYPGETGDIQSLLELKNIPYLGSGAEASKICFNKVNTKIWFEYLKIPQTPYIYLCQLDSLGVKAAEDFLKYWGKIFIKASHQGSSVGVYPVKTHQELMQALEKAFKLSPYVLLEKEIIGRELEVSAYEYNGSVHISLPGEILCPNKFYSYEEKYFNQSATRTLTLAPDIPENIIQLIKEYSLKVFQHFKLSHLARIDFFYTQEGEILLNEINSFPGLTPISMFPKMLESSGVNFSDFLNYCLSTLDPR